MTTRARLQTIFRLGHPKITRVALIPQIPSLPDPQHGQNTSNRNNAGALYRLPYLLHVPLAGGLVFRASGTWPRTNALYCHPVPAEQWPQQPQIVEQVPLRSYVRRGAAIDLILDRTRENRSQLVFTTAGATRPGRGTCR
jgi:hypothetical protein